MYKRVWEPMGRGQGKSFTCGHCAAACIGRFRCGILSDASCNFGSCSYRRHSIRNRGRNRQIGSGRAFPHGHTLVRRADPDADNCALLPGIEDTRDHLRIETSALNEEFVVREFLGE